MADGGERVPAGKVIDAALPRGDNGRSNLRGAAAVIVAGEFPHLEGAARRKAVDDWRRYLLRWVGGEDRSNPAGWVSPKTAQVLARYFELEPAALTRPPKAPKVTVAQFLEAVQELAADVAALQERLTALERRQDPSG